ncbi:porin family protein [Massilia sp. DD77]|uniref:porin family protein n=1 Tax=Massilia sp. DD77 TaxID=3109349 RepID=UPI002FFF2DFA
MPPVARVYAGASLILADHFEGSNKCDLKLFGGYEFNRNWGVEAGFSRHGGRDYRYFAWPDGQSESYRTKGFGSYVGAKYSLPIGERFAAHGKLGLAHSQRKLTGSMGWHGKESDNSVYAALAAEARLTENVALTLEFEHYGKEKRYGAENRQWGVGLKVGL